MKIRAWAACGTLGILCFLFAALALGGAAQLQPAVAKQARNESFLAHTYIVLDAFASRVPAIATLSRSVARQCFGATLATLDDDSPVALHQLFARSTGFMAGLAKGSYWAAPILLFLCLILHWLRPRPVHLMRR